MSDILFRVTNRSADDASTPRYQACTRVLKMANANIATTTPRIVSPDRNLWRNMFRNMSFSRSMIWSSYIESSKATAVCSTLFNRAASQGAR
jgi:hypothetical protein